jgi:YhcH/YjgK/YiaL family protein
MNNSKILRIDDIAAAAEFGEKYAKAFEFLRRPDLTRLSPGRYSIDGDRVFAIVSDNDLKAVGAMQTVEFHKKYADVQAPLTDEELFGLPDLPEAVANGPFDDEKDIAFFDAPCPMRAVRPGQCIVIEPLVAHAPCHTDEPGTRLRKVIVKVLF